MNNPRFITILKLDADGFAISSFRFASALNRVLEGLIVRPKDIGVAGHRNLNDGIVVWIANNRGK